MGAFSTYKKGSFETSGEGAKYYSRESADIQTEARSFGAYATIFSQTGFYADLVTEYANLTANIDAADLQSEAKGYGKLGQRFDIMKNIIIEPQIQFKAANIQWEDFNNSVHDIDFSGHIYMVGHGGIRLEKTFTKGYREIKPWIYAGVKQEFSGGASIKVAGLDFCPQSCFRLYLRYSG